MLQCGLIQAVHLGGLGLPLVFAQRVNFIGLQQIVFPKGNLVLGFVNGVAVIVAQNFGDDFRAVCAVQNGEILFVANVLGFFAQNPHTQSVKGGHGQAARVFFAQAVCDALLHFFGGFVGEGNGGDVVRFVADLGNHVGDFFGDDARFAAACACQHKQRTAHVFYGFLLLGIEFHEFQAA